MARRETSPLVDRCDIRLKTDATSKVERLKTSMVADRACQRLYGTPHPPWPPERDRNDWDSRPIQATMSLPKPKHWFRTPLLGAYVTQTPLSVDNLGSVARRTTPLGAEPAQKGHIRDRASGIARPRQNARYGRKFARSEPIDFWAKYSGSNNKFLTSGPSILDQTTNSKRWLSGLVISNIDNRR